VRASEPGNADLVFLGKPLAPVVAAIDFSRQALHLMRRTCGSRSIQSSGRPIAISGM